MENSFNTVLATIVSRFSADVGTIHKLDKKDNQLHLVAYTHGIPENIIEGVRKIPLGKGIAGTTAQEKKPTVIGDLVTDRTDYVIPIARTAGIQGMMCVPVFDKEEVVGTISVGCVKERQFTEPEIDKLIEIGKELADTF
ncbi:Signal transduction protein containing GAF and PtsI domains [Legionella beliardensis]|uniref:Signal transduction protein containing GAF and PtsI domains n=1 Tax=Legionella beliardensis TaxID=91822 RepID=A0A378HZU2_9GAMM|nr:GAF domain-containing protein [Legionella beliardensis]STX27980.1 Signal transduction protein containing GAF and PtsI domains [Legionella beliardensis]